MDRRAGLDVRCARRLAAFFRREQADLIHAHQYTPFAYSLLAGLTSHRGPVLFNEHGRFHPDRCSRRRVLFHRLMPRRRDRVIAVGEAVRKARIDNEGIRPARIGVIYNGVALGKLDGAAPQREVIRRELGIAARDFLIMQVARLDPIKDHGTAIRTMERVVAARPQTRLLIVGDGPERESICCDIQAHRLERQVRVLGERKDVPRLLAGADAFLLTSVSEGIPVTLIEAMGAQVPVVATDVGGVAEVVEHGRTGLLAPAGSDEQLADAILRLASDPSLQIGMGQAGRRRAEDLFTEEQMHRSYTEVYEAMLGKDH